MPCIPPAGSRRRAAEGHRDLVPAWEVIPLADLVAARLRRQQTQPVDSGLSGAWQPVLAHLVGGLDCDSLCGPSVVVRRLLLLAATCQEMHALVMTQALPALAARLPASAWSDSVTLGGRRTVPEVLRRLCRDPKACSQAELQDACRLAGVDAAGQRHQLLLRLLAFLGLTRPSTVPTELLLAVQCAPSRRAQRCRCPAGRPNTCKTSSTCCGQALLSSGEAGRRRERRLWICSSRSSLQRMAFRDPADPLKPRLPPGLGATSCHSPLELFRLRSYLTQAFAVEDERSWRALTATADAAVEAAAEASCGPVREFWEGVQERAVAELASAMGLQ